LDILLPPINCLAISGKSCAIEDGSCGTVS
jgi:hypothetical protein